MQKGAPPVGDELVRRLATVAVTTITPFDPDGEVDERALTAHCRWLVESGIEALVPCGHVGEYCSLTSAEVARVVEVTAAAAGPGCLVIAGVGGAAREAARQARDAEAAGASAILIHHPTHVHIDRRGLRRYYLDIIDASGLPAIIYKRSHSLDDRLLASLVELEQVVAVKYGVNDPHALSRLTAACRHGVAWMCGTAERWAPFFYLAGARGFFSGAANFAPRQSVALLAALEAGDYPSAMALRTAFVEFEDLREEDASAKNVPAVKSALRLTRGTSSAVRSPLSELTTEDDVRVSAYLASLGPGKR